MENFPLRYRKSLRARRLTIRVDPLSREIIVTHPASISERHANDFATKHSKWILSKVSSLPVRHRLGPQSVLTLNDRALTLMHEPRQSRAVIEDGDRLLIGGPPDQMGARALLYARHQADFTLPAQLNIWANIMSCTPSGVRCREVKSRWGSCTLSGRIMLSWRLILAPKQVRDYVIIHELTHLAHFDHSPAFWRMVERFHPQRRASQAWLKECGAALFALG